LKILMLNHEFPPVGGGASPVTFELCKHLVARGHQVDVVTMHYDNLPRFETVSGVNIYRTAAIRRRANICHTYELATYAPGAFRKTMQLVRHKRYDIIHCHFIVPGGLLAWLINRLTGIPFLITCHGSDVPGYNPDRFGLTHKLIQPIWRILVSKNLQLTTPSNSLKELILKHYSHARVDVISNGIDTDFYRIGKKEKSILVCSRMFPRKGLQYVIKAIKEMSIDWEVNIIGEGPYLPELREAAKDSKVLIKFWGWLDRNDQKFRELFNKSSIFIFTSEAESFGMVIAEAMAAGNAIIASDIPAHREVLANTGLFVEVRNSKQIRKQLQKLIDDEQLRKYLQKQAKKRKSQRKKQPLRKREKNRRKSIESQNLKVKSQNSKQKLESQNLKVNIK